MKEIIRKFCYIVLTFLFLLPYMVTPQIEVQAKTLGDIKKELNQFISEYEENKKNSQLTKEEIERTRKNIEATSRETEQIGLDIIALNQEIEELNVSIEEKNTEIKQIMNFVQLSNGESAYLEYAFGAKDFTDFIYRMAVAEQLTNYNNRLIDEYNQDIQTNHENIKKLSDKKVELEKKQKELATLLSSLQHKAADLEDESLSIEEEIELRKEAIDLYENQLGCKDNEDIDTCGRNILPPDTSFFRPLVSGSVSSEFGWRELWGEADFHGGLDMTTVDNNTPVYAAASGIVISIIYKRPCGNNIVFIQHNIKGLGTYTTAYWHLRKLYVAPGDRVTKDTQLGIMGGQPYEDTCATGPHVHFVVATGLYMVDYNTLSAYNSRRINPRIVLNAPAIGVRFKDRLTKY